MSSKYNSSILSRGCVYHNLSICTSVKYYWHFNKAQMLSLTSLKISFITTHCSSSIVYDSFIITARKRSCGKVMFLHLLVILFTGVSTPGSGGVHPLDTHPPGHTPRTPLSRHIPTHRDGHWSGWYASYCNAFLLNIFPFTWLSVIHDCKNMIIVIKGNTSPNNNRYFTVMCQQACNWKGISVNYKYLFRTLQY